jgi:hypothetical protein
VKRILNFREDYQKREFLLSWWNTAEREKYLSPSSDLNYSIERRKFLCLV